MAIIIILIIIIIFVCWFHYISSTTKFREEHMVTYKYNTVRPLLKTGDIILFSYNKHDNPLRELMYNCRTTILNTTYGHAAIVIRRNDELYAIECTVQYDVPNAKTEFFNDYKRGGVRIVDLDGLIKNYSEEYQGIFGVRFISEEIPNNEIVKHFPEYKEVIFQDIPLLAALVVTDKIISHNAAIYLTRYSQKNRMICTEFVHDILNKCGVLKDYPSKLFWPSLIGNENFDKYQKDNYSKVFRFVYS